MMPNFRPAVLLAFLFLLPGLAPAQTSDAQLRKENERLREESHRLQVQLDDLRERVEALESQIEALRQAIAAVQQGEAQAEGAAEAAAAPAPLPDDPFAAPDALFSHVRGAYEEAFTDMPHETASEVERYQRRIDRWVDQVNRDLTSDVRWVVRILEVDADEGNQATAAMTMVVEDPETGARIGGPFTAAVRQRTLRTGMPTPPTELAVLEAVLSAELTYDADRETQGMFNSPPFIGPYAAFGYELSVRSLSPYEPQSQAVENEETTE